MKKPFSTACILPLLIAASAHAADAPTMSDAKELKWVDVATPAGAKQSALWGDTKTIDQGVMMRWRFNSKVRDQLRAQDTRVVVLAGTFTVEIDGKYREFGPGGFVNIPKGIKHTLGCEAAGECKFLMHTIGSVDTAKSGGGN